MSSVDAVDKVNIKLVHEMGVQQHTEWGGCEREWEERKGRQKLGQHHADILPQKKRVRKQGNN